MGLCDLFDAYSAITIAVIVIISVIHYFSKFLLWRKLGVKGPTPLPFIGNMHMVFYKDLPSTHIEFSKKYGRLYGIYQATTPQLIISDPKIVKQMCVKDFHIFTNRRIAPRFHEIIDNMITAANDTQWKRLRKVISPTFTSGKIKRMKPLIEQCIRNGSEFLETTAENNELLNLKQFWSRFTLAVIACCCFAQDINSHKDPENIFLKHATELFKPPQGCRILSFLLFFILPSRISEWLGIVIVPAESLNYMSAAVRQLLIQRKQGRNKYNDFLQLLLEAENETEGAIEHPMTETEIIANCVLFFVAGYETTATLLSWSCFVLATHPQIQEKLFNELNENIDNYDNIEYETIIKLQYLDAFVCETLRMYPPLIVTERMNSAEIEIEGTGIKIPPKTLVTASAYALHHDAELYPEPESFIPDRFLGENRESIDTYSFLPFGTGPRNCVAMRFALFEAKLALIKSVLKFKFIKSTKTPLKPKFSKATTFLISENIFVNIEKR